jgi:hypothetical protein
MCVCAYVYACMKRYALYCISNVSTNFQLDRISSLEVVTDGQPPRPQSDYPPSFTAVSLPAWIHVFSLPTSYLHEPACVSTFGSPHVYLPSLVHMCTYTFGCESTFVHTFGSPHVYLTSRVHMCTYLRESADVPTFLSPHDCVHTFVSPQVRHRRCAARQFFVANVTFIHLSTIHAHMIIKVSLRREPLSASIARKWRPLLFNLNMSG